MTFKKFRAILRTGLNGLFLAFMVVALIMVVSFNQYTKRCEKRIASLEESMLTIQKTVISHDEIIFKSLTLLYEVADVPPQDKEMLQEIIKTRKTIWAINY